MKKLFVCFEGVDGVGKSTLAEGIANMCKVKLTHNDKSLSYEEGKKNSFNYIETLRTMPTGIIDRLVHTGEAIYAPIYRGYDGSDYFDELEEKMLDEFDILIVYVHASNETIERRLKSRGEDYINLEDISKLKENYEKFLSRTKFPYITFNTDDEDVSKNLLKLSLTIAASIDRNFNRK